MTTQAVRTRGVRQPGRIRGLFRSRRSAVTRWHPWVYAFVLAFWAASWDLRFSVLLSWMPIEPIRVASFALALCVVHRCGQPFQTRWSGAWLALTILVVGFLPGALESGSAGYAPDKVAALLLIVLPVLVASVVLLDTRAARWAWVWAQLVVGVGVVVGAVSSSHDYFLEPGRFSLATVNTVATGRLVGAAVVVLLLLAVTTRKHRWWALIGAAGCGMVLVQVGSRGPLLFALVAVVLVLLFARCLAGGRAGPLLAAGCVAGAAYVYALLAGGEGGQRVLGSLGNGLVDPIRGQLLSDAVEAGTAHLWGVGWGDFLDYSRTARSIANDRGVSYAHNAFAEAFSEGGVIALAAFAVFVVLAVMRLQRLTADSQDALVWGTLVYWLLNAMVSLDFVGNRFMWIALACAVTSPVLGINKTKQPTAVADHGGVGTARVAHSP